MKNNEEKNPIWETIFDLSYLAGKDNLIQNHYFDYDSRLLFMHIHDWAIEFEKKFENAFQDSDGYKDYIYEIEEFYNEKKKLVDYL